MQVQRINADAAEPCVPHDPQAGCMGLLGFREWQEEQTSLSGQIAVTDMQHTVCSGSSE